MDNYQRIILQKRSSGELPNQLGQVYKILCRHDPWCEIFHKPVGWCNCNVDVSIVYKPNRVHKPPQHTEHKPSRKRHNNNNYPPILSNQLKEGSTWITDGK